MPPLGLVGINDWFGGGKGFRDRITGPDGLASELMDGDWRKIFSKGRFTNVEAKSDAKDPGKQKERPPSPRTVDDGIGHAGGFSAESGSPNQIYGEE
jgi:hypothetical protein